MMAPKSTGRPVGYLRKSRVQSDKPGAVSYASQVAAVQKLAGDPDVLILEDWGVSGQHKSTRKREGFTELRRMIAADEVSIVLSYSMSRLARSPSDLSNLLALCEDHGVPVETAKGDINTSNATGKLITGILSYVNAFIAEIAEEHAAETMTERRAHVATGCAIEDGSCGFKHRIGRTPYGAEPGEDRQRVLDTFTRVGTFSGTMKALNNAGVPSRGGKDWDDSSVAKIVRAAGLAPPMQASQRGVALRSTRLFSMLLRCHCGTTLTSTPTASEVRYICPTGRKVGQAGKVGEGDDERVHGPYQVSEAKIRPWAETAVASAVTLDPKGFSPAAGSTDDIGQRMAALDARRERIIDQYTDGLIDKPKRDRLLGAVEADRAKVDTTLTMRYLRVVGLVDWTAPAGEVNAKLRKLWAAIVLGRDLAPKRAEWRPTEEYGTEGPE